ncbi:hypothetical protein N0V93_003154 [Gnomoniopsis smithogilvyi]|uniref:PPPDE domain-containing protein n=1 Tax=Gnomoniopsis smithogilvyi TaxID=1191159 RepID=A0A9W8YZW8_9PEZI|nr:hypothetical protein N0V93_003154 [Gnomoniopsis smithogilvyi]
MKISTGSHHETISRIPRNPTPSTTNVKRTVQIGYRPVGGRVAAWTIGLLNEFVKRMANMGIRTDDKGPNPHHHWCVIVGDYYHHAQITNGLMWYENEEISWKDGWSLFEVGETTFNDTAVAEAALRTLHQMPEGYDLWSNNCHHFALRLIDSICPAGHRTLSKSRRYHRKSSSMHLIGDGEGLKDS